jgi:hypothetical protein
VVLKPFSKKEKGQTFIVPIVAAAVSVVVILAIIAGFNVFMVSYNTPKAIDFLTGQGYVVLAAGEYDLIAKEATAYAAVVNAEVAVIAAEEAAAKVDLFNSAEVFLFPTTTNLTCVFTAGNTNVWSAWTEVEDSGTTTLSSAFAVDPGYISDMLFFLPSDAADGYNIELAYGASKTNLGRVAMWALADGDIAYTIPIKSRRVPAGETIYYRMQSTGANGATVQVRFRYFYE